MGRRTRLRKKRERKKVNGANVVSAEKPQDSRVASKDEKDSVEEATGSLDRASHHVDLEEE